MTETERPRVLVVGSINTDLVMHVAVAPEAGETVTGQSFATFGGGKGANQAVSAARSGAEVAILGGVGNDDFGRQRLLDLRNEGVSTNMVSTVDDMPSGVAIILVEPGGENRIAYVPGATWGVTPAQAVQAVEAWRPDVVLATLEHQRAVLTAVWGAAKSQGIPIICNATPEPSLGRDLALASSALVVNEVEALELTGQENSHDWPGTAQALRRLGPEIVAITLGSSGALVCTADGTEEVPALKVDAIDATGAGDAFCGAFAAALGRGESPGDALRTAVVAGSLSVTRPGAQPSMPALGEIEAALRAL